MTTPSSPPQGFFQRRPLRRALRNWLARHRHPVNLGLHLVGIPLACAGLVWFFMLGWPERLGAAAAFVAGYVLQWLGHRLEGNDVGEWAAVKRLLGWPYVSIAPEWQTPAQDDAVLQAECKRP